MTDSEIRAATSAAIDKAKWAMIAEGKIFPVRGPNAPATTKCKWCGKPSRKTLCSPNCMDEYLGGPESYD